MKQYLRLCVCAVLLCPSVWAQDPTYQQYDTALLRALDKVTGRSYDFQLDVSTPQIFGSLRMDLKTCYQRPPEEPPESAAFLVVRRASAKRVDTMAVPRALTPEEKAISEADDAQVHFSGWMFASSPGLNALEHPVYDVWVIACSEAEPVISEPGRPAE